MDSLISRITELAAIQDGDLMLCEKHGVAYQRDMTSARVSYDENYMAKVDAYEDTDIAKAVNAGRCALISRHVKKGAKVLDIGAGSGAFVRAAIAAGFDAKGFEVIPQAVERLRAAGLYATPDRSFDAFSLWDVIEHLENPEESLSIIPPGAWLFVSLPIFPDLRTIRESKHYRPGEHLYYFQLRGLVDWMALHGYRYLDFSGHEIDAGRESIGAFAFVRKGRL